jgi:hypothetical protein
MLDRQSPIAILSIMHLAFQAMTIVIPKPR